MRHFTVATIAALTSCARGWGFGLDTWWLEVGPMPGESVADVLCRAGAQADMLHEYLRGAGVLDGLPPEGRAG